MASFCVDAAGPTGSIAITTAFEAVSYPLAPAVGVQTQGPSRWFYSGCAELDRLWIAAAAAAVADADDAAAWCPGRGSGHERLSPPCPASFWGCPNACDLACHKHSLFSYPRFRSAFTPAVLAFGLPSGLSATLPCRLVPAAATDLPSRRVAVCRRAASLV